MGAPSKEEIAAMVNSARDHGPVPGYGHRRFFRVIVALADENDRLRAELATETACHLSNLATMNKESVEYRSENGRLRAERAEVLALLDDDGMSFDALDYCSLVDDAKSSELDCDEPYGRPCWEHRRRALVAKLRGAP